TLLVFPAPAINLIDTHRKVSAIPIAHSSIGGRTGAARAAGGNRSIATGRCWRIPRYGHCIYVRQTATASAIQADRLSTGREIDGDRHLTPFSPGTGGWKIHCCSHITIYQQLRWPAVDAGVTESHRVATVATADTPVDALIDGIVGVGKPSARKSGIVIVDGAVNTAETGGVFLNCYG